jgi:predicted GNAT family N-acyltransferase
MSTSFVDLIQPPGQAAYESLKQIIDNDAPLPSVPANAHATFLDALLVRKVVFIDEQGCRIENEVDSDDLRSYHWVVHASVSVPSGSTSLDSPDDLYSRRKNAGGRVPVGTIRLVPSPHARHPVPGSVDGEGGDDVSTKRVLGGDVPTKYHDGREAYVKIGRMATVKEYRGLGLGKLLVNEALQWAAHHKEKLHNLPENPVEREKLVTAEGREWKGFVMAHAQVTAVRFYQGMGFEVDEQLGTWVEEGIEHVAMWKRLEVDAERRMSS